LVALLAGTLLVTSDVRHGSLTSTLLGTPRRGTVLAAKCVVAVGLASVMAVVDLGLVLAVGLLSGAVDPAMVNADIVLRVAGLALAYPLYALLEWVSARCCCRSRWPWSSRSPGSRSWSTWSSHRDWPPGRSAA
jgi:hypothetical protein